MAKLIYARLDAARLPKYNQCRAWYFLRVYRCVPHVQSKPYLLCLRGIGPLRQLLNLVLFRVSLQHPAIRHLVKTVFPHCLQNEPIKCAAVKPSRLTIQQAANRLA